MFLFVAQSFFFFLGTCNQKNHTIDTRSDVIPSPERIRTWVICLAGREWPRGISSQIVYGESTLTACCTGRLGSGMMALAFYLSR